MISFVFPRPACIVAEIRESSRRFWRFRNVEQSLRLPRKFRGRFQTANGLESVLLATLLLRSSSESFWRFLFRKSLLKSSLMSPDGLYMFYWRSFFFPIGTYLTPDTNFNVRGFINNNFEMQYLCFQYVFNIYSRRFDREWPFLFLLPCLYTPLPRLYHYRYINMKILPDSSVI